MKSSPFVAMISAILGAVFSGTAVTALEFSTGTFWEYRWEETEDSFAQGSAPRHEYKSGRFLVRLGARIETTDFPEYPLEIEGDPGPFKPRWHTQGIDATGRIWARSNNAPARVLLFDPAATRWPASGFIAEFQPDQIVEVTSGSISNAFISSPAQVLRYSSRQGGCETFQIPGVGTICPGDRTSTAQLAEYWREDLGAIGYDYSLSYSFSGGGFSSGGTIVRKVGLVGTSLRGDQPSLLETEPSQKSTPVPLPLERRIIGRISPGDATDRGWELNIHDWYALHISASAFLSMELEWSASSGVELKIFVFDQTGAELLDLSFLQTAQAATARERIAGWFSPGKYLLGVAGREPLANAVEYELEAKQLNPVATDHALASWRTVRPTTNSLNSVRYLNGGFVAVSSGGGILASSDGTEWSWKRAEAPANSILNTSAFGEGTYLFQGDRGATFVSTDLQRFDPVNANTIAQISVATYGNGIFVAVGVDGTVLTSDDGKVWRVGSLAGEVLLNVAFGAGRFVAVGYDGSVFNSTDGRFWSENVPVNSDLWGVTYANGEFVVVGSTGTILRSSGGRTWIPCPSPTTRRLTAIAFGEGRYVVTGEGGMIFTSADLQNWQIIPRQTQGYLIEVDYGAGAFVAVGENGTLLVANLRGGPSLPSLQIRSSLPATLTITGTPGKGYRVEASEKIGPSANWSSAATITLQGPTAAWSDPGGGNFPARFYRLAELP